ncbi:hypothetical protein BKA62DRAFT_829163 [Auriculariales sp. MPI-PUGE-AT-0066]|nr:hypothetical protein BKA62DRAFT_829163 [Auriculariales sp. MPI-PUGE-AT-0066]
MGPIPFPRMPANIYNIVDFAPLCVILVVPLLNVAWLVEWKHLYLEHTTTGINGERAGRASDFQSTQFDNTFSLDPPCGTWAQYGQHRSVVVRSKRRAHWQNWKIHLLAIWALWLITVPTLWVLNTLLIVRIHVFVVKSIRNPDAAPVLAQQLGASALTLGGITGAIPLGTYLLSLPLLHDWCDGWPVDVLVLLVLPLLGLAIAAWGVMLKLRFRETVFPNVQPPELL